MNEINNGLDEQVFDPFILEDLRQMSAAEHYNKWLYTLISPYLGKNILEIGPGIGNITLQMIDNAKSITGVEPNQYCCSWLKETMKGFEHFKLLNSKVGHYRRYSKKWIRDLFKQTRLIPEKITYSNFYGLMGWLYNAKVRKFEKQDNRQISVFDRLVQVISFLERFFAPPIGLSLLVVYRKKS